KKRETPALGVKSGSISLRLSLKGGQDMKKAINVLMAGCLLGSFTSSLFSTSAPGGLAVEAAPALAFFTRMRADELGTPLAGAIVAVLEPRPRGKEIKSAKTDTQGRFSAGVTPGTYLLRAAAEGFKPKLSTRQIFDRPTRFNYNFALNRDTLVQKRGDRDDYRWISLSVQRHAMNVFEDAEEEVFEQANDTMTRGALMAKRSSFHGMMQFVAATSSGPAGSPAPDFFGSTFAVSGSVGGNFEMALIGQRGAGELSP